MDFAFSVEPASFVERPNRFVIHARLHRNGQVVRVHCPNPGRMHELMVPGATVYVDRAADAKRRTAYTLRFVEHPDCGQLISLDTQLPNHLLAEGLSRGFFPPFSEFTEIEREVTVHPNGAGVRSRIDFRLSTGPHAGTGSICWVETKSVTLVEGNRALFPDAPTLRGRRHLEELIALRAVGDRAAVVFIVQRPDARVLAPHRETDPRFAETLRQAQEGGVELYAYTCGVTTGRVWLEQEIPVEGTG